MADHEQTPAAEGPTVHDVLSMKVYMPEFIKACNSLGIAPQSDEDLHSLLQIAQAVRVQEMKTAEAQTGEAEPNLLTKAAAAAQMVAGIETAPEVSGYLADADVAQALEAGGLPA